MNPFSRRLNVQGRIALVSVAFVAGLAVVGAIFMANDTASRAAFARHAHDSSLRLQAEAIRALAMDLKASSRDIRFRRIDTDADTFLALQKRLRDAVATLQSSPGSAAFASQENAVAESVAAIVSQYDVVNGWRAKLGGDDGLVAAVDKAATGLDQAVMSLAGESDSADVLRLQAAVATLRHAEAAFQASISDDVLATWEVAFGRIDRRLGKADLPDAQKAGLADALKTYGAVFRPWTDAERAFMRAAETLTGDFDLIDPKLQALDDAVAAREAETAAALDTNATRAARILEIAITLAIVIGLAIAIAVGRNTAALLHRLRDAMLALTRREFTTDVPFATRSDEVGEMARAVQIFKDNALALDRATRDREAVETAAQRERAATDAERSHTARQQSEALAGLAEGLQRLADGDLTWRISRVFAAEYEPLRQDFNMAIGRMEEALGRIAAGISGVRNSAVDVTTAANDLARRTEQQASNLEEAAAALGEMTSTVGHSAKSADEARGVVNVAAESAQRSAAVMDQTRAAMVNVEKVATEVGQIIGVINEIAFQTNLLALNAGVEAARAGETGRGFAVVASEVRTLAQRSGEAAKEISALVAASVRNIETGVALVGETGASLENILTQVASANTLVNRIAGAASEQAEGLGQINTAVHDMDRLTQQNAARVQETAVIGQSLFQDVEDLVALIAAFRTGTGRGTTGEIRRAA